MRVSNNFEAALKAGSDIARVGAGIFGKKKPTKTFGKRCSRIVRSIAIILESCGLRGLAYSLEYVLMDITHFPQTFLGLLRPHGVVDPLPAP